MCVCVWDAQSSPTLFDPIDCSPPGSSVPGISQARILEWVAISFSNKVSILVVNVLHHTESYRGLYLIHT